MAGRKNHFCKRDVQIPKQRFIYPFQQMIYIKLNLYSSIETLGVFNASKWWVHIS